MLSNYDVGFKIMEIQSLFNLGFTAAGCLLGFILHGIRSCISNIQRADAELTDKVQRIEVLVAGKYLTLDQHSKDMGALFSQLRRIEDKLDNAPCKESHLKHTNDFNHNHHSYQYTYDKK